SEESGAGTGERERRRHARQKRRDRCETDEEEHQAYGVATAGCLAEGRTSENQERGWRCRDHDLSGVGGDPREQSNSSPGHPDGLGDGVPGLFRQPVELPQSGQSHRGDEKVKDDGRRPKQNREHERDGDSGGELPLQSQASGLIISIRTFVVIPSEARNLPSSKRTEQIPRRGACPERLRSRKRMERDSSSVRSSE